MADGNPSSKPDLSRSDKFETVAGKGKALMAEGKWVEAIASLAEAVKVARQENRPDLEVQAYDLIGEALIKKGDRDKAEKYLVRALDLAKSKENWPGLAATYKVFGYLAMQKADREAAGKYYASMLELAEKQNLTGFQGRAHADLAQLAADYGDMPKAIEGYKKAIDILEKTEGEEARHELARAYLNLGEALEMYGDHARGLTYFEKAKDECLRCADAHGRALAEVGVAECCMRLGFTVRAMEQLETARADLMKLKDNAGLGEVYRISGALMTAQANWNAAKSHLDRALNFLISGNPSPRYTTGLIRTYTDIGRMHRLKGDTEKMEKAFKDARDLAAKLGSKRISDWVQRMSDGNDNFSKH